MTETEQWNCEEPVTQRGIEVPKWIDQDISPSTIQAVIQGGCASGAYMPAMWYSEAIKTMGQYGDEVVAFLGEQGEQLDHPMNSWGEIACLYLSSAVEVWCSGAAIDLEQDN